jgi:hypothetical protein
VPKAIRAANDVPEPVSSRTLYEADEHAWIAAQISALNDGQFNRLDRANLAAYLTDMTIRDRRELQSRLTVLLQHLLKIRMQRSRLTRSWIGTVLEQQREIRAIVVGIPSLGREADAIAALAYPDAVRAAARETGIAAEKFPATSPWTVDQALAFDPPEPAARSRRRP